MNIATQPLAVNDTKAAAMLDMSATDFRRLVGQGALPPPKEIGGRQRWSVAELMAGVSGEGRKACINDDFE